MENSKYTSLPLDFEAGADLFADNDQIEAKNKIELANKPGEIRKTTTITKDGLPNKGKSIRFYLGDAWPGFYLTLQEARCIVCFLEGLNNRQAALILRLAVGTVNFYGGNMRLKLRCQSRKELLNRVKNSDFQHYYEALKQGIFNCA